MKKLIGCLVVALFPILAFAQPRTVSGIVRSSEDNQPIPGVNVVIEGTNNGTVTDIDGKYSISLSETGVLVFSFVGFETQRIQVGEQSVLDVILILDSKTLEEVVIVGYGIQKKSDVTGATATVKGDELIKQPVLTATQAMQGKVAGVQIISSGQPGSSPQIRIRGVSTAFSGTTSLFVVDGVLTDDISNINTADIVDINILKDASAAAIYGSRGANGVIIITTKKGKKGSFSINYNNNIGIRQAANLVEMANAAEYSNYVQAATGSAPPPSSYDTDWYDVILRTAWQQTHNISLSGGSDKSTYMLNVGYLQDQGIVIDNEFKRLTVRFNSDYDLRKDLTFGLQSSFGNSINQNGFGNVNIDPYGNIGGVYNDAYRAAPIITDIVGGKYGNTSAYQNVGNPLLDIKSNDIRVKENRLQTSAFLEYKPIKWLSLRSSIGTDIRSGLNRGYYYALNDTIYNFPGGNQLRSLSGLTVNHAESFRWVWDNTATLHQTFDKHDVTLLLGTTAEHFNLTWISANRSDVPADPDLWYISVGDANTSQNDGGGDEWARNSYLARVNYSFDGKYLLTATLRADGSSRLPGKNRWQQYPSLGIGWVMSREAFLQSQNIFDLLKLRASYGKVGNDQIPTNAFTSTVALNRAYSFNGSASAATNGAQINQIIDPNINWETTEEYDLAIEWSAFEAKLSGEVNYYNKKVNNALINIPIPRTVGDIDGVITTNAASIENKGLEIVLGWKNTVNDRLTYNVSGNITLNRNNVVALNGGQAIWGGGIGAAQGYTTYTDNGQPIGSFYVLKTIGVFNTSDEVSAYQKDGNPIQPNAKPGDFKYLDKNNDGKIDDLDRVFAGSYQPVAFFGINAGVNYSRWDFSMSLYANVGNEVYNGKKAVRVQGTDNIEKDMVYKRWTSANRSQSQPGANTGNLPASDYFVEPGDFIRINNLTVGYTVPSSLLERYHIGSLRMFITSQNLFTLKRYSGFTPELPGDPLNSGIELSAYPTTRTIAAGVNIGF